MLGETSLATIILLIFSFAISVSTLLYLRFAVKKEHEHTKKIIAVMWRMKDHLQEQISGVEKKREDCTKSHKERDESLKKWLGEELQKQHLANELAVTKVANAVETIAESRKSLAKSLGGFVRLLRVVMRAEKSLMDVSKQARPKKPADPAKDS